MHRSSLHQLAQRPKHASPVSAPSLWMLRSASADSCLGYFTLDQMNSIEGIFEDIGEPVPWPATIHLLWSYLLTVVDEEWMNFGNKLSDIQEPALEVSAPEVTPPLTITLYSGLNRVTGTSLHA